MGYANLEELVRFREIAMGFQTRSKDKFFTDVHYTVWVKSKFDLPELDFEKYAELSDNRTEWLSNIMNEGKEFIQYMVDSLKSLNDHNIKIDNKFK